MSKVLSNVIWDDELEEYKRYKIVVSPVKKRGKNFPSKKYLADHVDKNGRFDELTFLMTTKKIHHLIRGSPEKGISTSS